MRPFYVLLALLPFVFAVEIEGAANESSFDFGATLFAIAFLLIFAKTSSLITRFGQPAVLGELLVGLILGNLILVGVDVFEPLKSNEILLFFAELGVVLLLFQIGLESNIHEMRKVGANAFLVAVLGVFFPFVLGAYLVGPALLPGLSQTSYLFLGAALTATSVGITARVFKDLNKLQTKEAQTILGAAVIDDVLGLIILAVVSAIATAGFVSLEEIAFISLKAILFLGGSIVVGQKVAPYFNQFFSRIHTGVGMKFTVAIFLCFLFAYLAQFIGLAPIVGAFAIGLILDPVHFRYFKNPAIVDDIKRALKDDKKASQKVSSVLNKHADKHVEDLIEPLSTFFVPLFFVITGMNVDLSALFDSSIMLLALALTIVAVIGKLLAGIAASRDCNKLLVGMGMVPRGEVGLIFAAMGKNLGVLGTSEFSVIVVMVILTTLIAPPLLSILLHSKKPRV